MLSLTATRRPASGPSPAPVISVVTYQAPSSLSAAAGHRQARSGGAGSRAACSRSTTSYDVSAPAMSSRNSATSARLSPSPYLSAIAVMSSSDGGVMAPMAVQAI